MCEVVPLYHHSFKHRNRLSAGLHGLFISLLCLLSLMPDPARAQVVSEAWTSLFWGPNYSENDMPSAMTRDAFGNVYIAGSSQASYGTQRVATIKYDSLGNELWRTFYDVNRFFLYVNELQIDSGGNVFVTGNTEASAFVIQYDTGGSHIATSVSDAITSRAQRFSVQPDGGFSLAGLNHDTILAVEKYNAAGNLVSAHQSNVSSYVVSLSIDASNNIVVGGNSTNMPADMVLAKYNPAGNLLWETNYNRPQSGADYLSTLTVDTQGNIFVAGVTMDSDYNNAGAILIKYDAAGNRSWVSALASLTGNPPSGVQVDGFGNIFVIQPDFTVFKCDPNGTVLWHAQPGPVDNYYYSYAVSTLDGSGNLYISGSLLAADTFTPKQRVTVKFDAQGHEIWSQNHSVSADSSNYGFVIDVDASGNVLVTGNSRDVLHLSFYATTKYAQTNMAGLPVITQDPQSMRATAFTTVTFNVSVTGTAPFTYQWSYNNQPMPGMTNASLVLTNVAAGDGGDYSVAITNSVGWSRSREASLVLDIPPVIDASPESLTLALGETVTLGVGAHGDLPLSFQWQCNGTNLPGATNSTIYFAYYATSSLVLSPVSLASQGDYRVVVSNSFGMVTSAVARVRVSRQVQAQWTSSITGPPYELFHFYGGFMTTDASGNIFLTGTTSEFATNHDYITVKLDSAGHQLWSSRYDGTGADDTPYAIALDPWGNVYVTGASPNTNGITGIATLKYDANGNQLWVARDDGTNDSAGYARQIAVDDAANVYVTGLMLDTNGYRFYLTTKYTATGVQAWRAVYRPGIDVDAFGLALDRQGNVLVAGSGGIIKYDSSGNQLWHADSNYAFGLKTDANNNVYVLGSVNNPGTSADYSMEKYDSAGHLVWSSIYASCGENYDGPAAFAVAEDGSVYVTGNSRTQNSIDYLTVKFAPEGQLLWAARFSDRQNYYCRAAGIAIDDFGNAYVTGDSQAGGINLITTIKYDQNGSQVWTTEYTPPGGVSGSIDLIVASQTNLLVNCVTIGPEPFYKYTLIAYGQTNTPGLPVILTPPQGQMVLVNSNVVLKVTGTGGPLQYQWRRFGTNLAGATQSTLTIPNFQPADGGDYSVILDNGLDITVSAEARLTPYTQLYPPTRLPTGDFSFTLVGEKGRGYDIYRSADLVTWDAVTNVFNSNGITGFMDSYITNSPTSYYRAIKVP